MRNQADEGNSFLRLTSMSKVRALSIPCKGVRISCDVFARKADLSFADSSYAATTLNSAAFRSVRSLVTLEKPICTPCLRTHVIVT